jgi:hypothetical protein
MAVSEHEAGTYRQIADTLRWKRGRLRVKSVRPVDDKNEHYTDSPDRPTLVTFETGDEWVNVPMLLKQGAIAQYSPPKKTRVVHETVAPVEEK